MTEESPAIAPMKTKAKVPLAPVRTPVIQSVWTWFWVALLAACIPMLAIYFSRMWRLDHYQYFPFAIGAVVWLGWTRSDRYFYAPSQVSSLLMIAMGTLAMVGSWSLRSPWMMSIAFMCIAAACLAVMRGPRDESLLALALPLLLLIRLPLGYDQLLVIELQRITTLMSSLLLDVLSIPHAVTRNVIELPNRELFVAEACSGIQSVFTMAFLSTLLVSINRRKLWLAPLYMVIALILAVGGNVLRVTLVSVFDQWLSLDLASGWAHDILGYTTLAISAFFLWSFDGLVMTTMHVTSTNQDEHASNPILSLWNWVVDDGQNVNAVNEYYQAGSITPTTKKNGFKKHLDKILAPVQKKPIAIAMGGVGIALVAASTLSATKVDSVGIEEGAFGAFTDGMIFDSPVKLIESGNSDFVLSNHQQSRDGDNPVLGPNSDVWLYQAIIDGQPIEGQFVISQTYSMWHELSFCYESQSYRNNTWRLLNRVVGNQRSIQSEEASQELNPCAYALFGGQHNSRGYLWYTGINRNGHLVYPPDRPGRLGNRIAHMAEGYNETVTPMMMIQLWISSDTQLDVSITNKIAAQFDELRLRVALEVQAKKGFSTSTSEVSPTGTEVSS
ncbi:exosortase U [Rhodopirellula baltica]